MGAIKQKTCPCHTELIVSLNVNKVNRTAGSIRYPNGQNEEKIRNPSSFSDYHVDGRLKKNLFSLYSIIKLVLI